MRIAIIFACLCSFATPVFAASHGTPYVNTFSGIGSNFGGLVYFDPGQPFLNRFKAGNVWGGSPAGTVNLDSNGYPTSMNIVGGGTFSSITTFLMNYNNVPGAQPPNPNGVYILRYDGTGTWTPFGDISTTNANPNRYVMNVNSSSALGIASNIQLRITATDPGATGDYMRNMALIYCPDCVQGASFTGSISGTALTSGTVTGTAIAIGQTVTGPGVATGTVITAGSGSSWTVNINQTVGSEPMVSTVLGTNEKAYLNGEILAPEWKAYMQYYRTCTRDLNQINNQISSNWANRTLPTSFSWAGTNPGGQWSNDFNLPVVETAGTYPGLPVEIMVQIANELNCDLYFNIPVGASDSYVTNAATIVHNQLNPGLGRYIEYGNENWNLGTFVHAHWVSQMDTAVLGGGGVGFNYRGMRTAQISALWKAIDPSAKIVLGVQTVPSTGFATNSGEIFSTLLWTGDNRSGLSSTVTFSSPDINWTGHTLTAGTPVEFTNSGGALPTFSTGPDNCCNAYYVSTANLTTNSFRVANTHAHALAGTNTITMTGGSGTQTATAFGGPAYPAGMSYGNAWQLMDDLVIAPYFWYGVPEAWTGDADGGLTRYFTEVMYGGLEPTTGVATTGSGSAYVLTSGQGLSGTPPNGTCVGIEFSVDNLANATLTVDSMSALPIQIRVGTNIAASWVSGVVGINAPRTICFTNAVGNAPATISQGNPCFVGQRNFAYVAGSQVKFVNNGDTLPSALSFGTTYFVEAPGSNGFSISATNGGTAIDCTSGSSSGIHLLTAVSVTPAWVLVDEGTVIGYPGGMIKYTTDETADWVSYMATNFPSLGVNSYEAGPLFLSSYSPYLEQLYDVAQDGDPRFYQAMTEYLNGWKSAGGHLMNNFTNIGPNQAFGDSGLKQNLYQPDSPKGQAMTDFIRRNPCWWNGCPNNFLLKRDLDPASNDNSPVWLHEAA